MRPLSLCITLALSASVGISHSADLRAADKKDAAWDITAAHGKMKSISFETDEGTWLDLDVSRDGGSIVFSMMGDLYTLPIAGGRATRLTSGPAWDVQPRFSPDGRRIAFTSDRAGGNNLWTIARDGSGALQITKESFRLFNNPAWTPDGEYLIGRKHFTSGRSLGAGELWMFPSNGKASAGLQLTKRKNDQMDLGEPAVSPDGRYVYYSEDVSPGSTFQYNKNVHGTIYAIKRYDRETGQNETLINTPGGAIRPQPSPDGKQLAFVKRVRDKTVLHVMDLQSGAVRAVWDGLSHDQQEVWAIFGPYPNFQWLPDSQSVVIWAKGKLHRVDMRSGSAANIAFQATVQQQLTAPIRAQYRVEGERFTARTIRDVATSPDGGSIVLHAVGSLWIKRGNAAPQRLSRDDSRFEYQPSFSADGRSLLFTTFKDESLGAIHEMDLASGAEKVLSTQPGYYYGPRYSPDGKRIVYSRTAGGGLVSPTWSFERGVFVMDRDGRGLRKLSDEGETPQFNADGSRVMFLAGGGLSKQWKSIGVMGDEPREMFNMKYPNAVAVSPDGKWVAFSELYQAYIAPIPQTGASIELNKDSKALPITRISKDVGDWLHWSADSKTVHWVEGPNYFSRPVNGAVSAATSLAVDVASDAPSDTFAFVGARVITMRDAERQQEVIEDGVVIVRGSRIVAVGPRASTTVPQGATLIDAAGKTLYPGIVDVHGHGNHFGGGVVARENWAYYANLAFGVTTLHDPSASTEMVFSQSELQKAGIIVGPRVYSTGTILYGADGDFKVDINSLDDARSHLRRLKSVGAFSVKSYNQPRRDQRQMVNTAARELGMLVVEEGGSTFQHNLTMMVDGVTGIEHNLPVAPLYRDVIETWRQTDVRNTPTLVVNYSGINGEFWWYSRDNVWEDSKLQRFLPRAQLDARSIRREIGPDWDYTYIDVAKAAKKLRDAGVRIQVGGHGQLQGLGTLWEMWMFVQGGMTPFEALRAGTIDGADYIGFAQDLGSIEVGKRADLVIVDGNPLQDIRATRDTAYVMINGRLFETAGMKEIGGKQRPAPSFHFSNGNGASLNTGLEHGPAAEHGPAD